MEACNRSVPLVVNVSFEIPPGTHVLGRNLLHQRMTWHLDPSRLGKIAMTLTLRSLAFTSLLLLPALCGVSCHRVASSTRPVDPTFADTRPVESCTQGAPAMVMTLDMRPEDRARLEAALTQGVVGVSYDCKKLEVLPDCTAQGKYTYLGLSRKSETVDLSGAQELSANLPFAGLEGELKQGTSLSADMTVIGRRAATFRQLDANELRGNCAGATHFVRAASVGAYSLRTAAQSQTRAGAGYLGVSAQGEGSSAKRVLRAVGIVLHRRSWWTVAGHVSWRESRSASV